MLAATPDAVTNVAALIHVLVLIPAIFFAVLADGLAISTFFRPVEAHLVVVLRRLHRIIMASLILMWLTGLVMLGIKLLPGGSGLTPKLVAKLTIVASLSFNAMLIGYFALPQMRDRVGDTFDRFPPTLRLALGAVGGLSSGCWISALLLGTVPAMKTMSYGMLTLYLTPLLAGAVMAGALMAVAAPRIAAFVKTGPATAEPV